MPVTVELFGIPRERAGVSSTTAEAARLGELFRALAAPFPRLAEACFDGDRLRTGYIANLNGERFVSDPATPLADGDAVLILSADAGG
jgi:sulfur-carrier protein